MKIICMKNYQMPLLLLVVSFFLSGSSLKYKKVNTEGTWTGFVSFFEKKTGPKIVFSDWKMEATVKEDICNVVHSYRWQNLLGDTVVCRSEEQAALEVGFDEEKGKYYISVRVPGCPGVSDETEIVINDQPIPNDPNVLRGQIVLHDGPDANGDESKTTYTWHLEKNKSPDMRNNR